MFGKDGELTGVATGDMGVGRDGGIEVAIGGQRTRAEEPEQMTDYRFPAQCSDRQGGHSRHANVRPRSRYQRRQGIFDRAGETVIGAGATKGDEMAAWLEDAEDFGPEGELRRSVLVRLHSLAGKVENDGSVQR